MATDTLVALDPATLPGGRQIKALLLTDGTSVVPITGLVVSNDGTSDPTAVSIANPLPVAVLPPFPPTYYVGINAVSGNVKATPGRVYSFKAVNRNAVNRYLMLFDMTSVPPPSQPIFDQFLVPGLGILVIGTDYFSLSGISLPTGISFGFSTVPAVYTPATAVEHDFSMVYT